MTKTKDYSYFLLRVLVGLLMVVPGVIKMMDPSKPLALLLKIGFPFPNIFVWILIFSEIVFGALLIIGFKVKYTVWPLIFILFVAVFTVTIPGKNPTSIIFHLFAIATLFHIFANGAGKWGLSKN